ncbi:unnamed protein product, partial [Cochlearia groenlandica]
RKYNVVVLASPKKRLLLNRIYGTPKSPGKSLKNKLGKQNATNPLIALAEKNVDDTGNKGKPKGGGSGVGNKGAAG